jgi:putative alpha-1,2-mannosidase
MAVSWAKAVLPTSAESQAEMAKGNIKAKVKKDLVITRVSLECKTEFEQIIFYLLLYRYSNTLNFIIFTKLIIESAKLITSVFTSFDVG